MRYEITLNGKVYEVEVEDNRALLGPVGVAPVAPAPAPGVAVRPAVSVGQPRVVRAAPAGARPIAARPAGGSAAAHGAAAAAPSGSSKGENLPAPMPGLIKEIRVQPGQAVKAGQVLIILEAMKMENEIVAPANGTVTEVSVSKGQTVGAGTPLLKIAK